jgi:phosphatidylinositol alpha-mannosyltransferase
VEYLGEVSVADKVTLLHSLSAFCQPSIKPEVLGTAALEAQAAGVPVVAPDEGVFPGMLGLTGGGVMFESGDVDALAERLAELMDDPVRADAMGESGAAQVARQFSAELAPETMEAILTALEAQGDGEEAV